MKRKIFLSILVLTFFVAGFHGPVRAQGRNSDDKRISDVQVEGNKAVSTATILSRLKMKPGDMFVESALNKELKRLYAMGYFADVFVETEERAEGMVVIFTVIEKPVIKRIEFRGNVKIKDAHLAKKLTVKEGDLLDFNLIAQDIAELKTYYVEQGYSRVKIDYSIETDPETEEATLVF